MAIKFKGVYKVPGRPTIVDGIEGRRYVANKILNNMSPGQSGKQNPSIGSVMYESEVEYEYEYGVDENGLETERLNDDPRNTETAAASASLSPTQKRFLKAPKFEVGDIQQERWDHIQEEPGRQEPWLELENPTIEGHIASKSTEEVIGEKDLPAAQEPQESGLELDAKELEPALKEEGQQQIHHEQHGENVDDEVDDFFDYDEDQKSNMSYREAASEPISFDQPEELTSPTRKTAILRVPTPGVVRSSRGTVELLVHANGRTFRPGYNLCGLLTSVYTSDGIEIVNRRHESGGGWSITDALGNNVEEEPVITVAFDKKGNLWYETTTGKRVTFHIDGSIETTTA